MGGWWRWALVSRDGVAPCAIKSRSSLLAPAHVGGPRKRAVKLLWWCAGSKQHKVEASLWLWAVVSLSLILLWNNENPHVVIQASLQSEISRTGGAQTGFVSLCREILSRFIMDRFPTVVEGIVSDVVICREAFMSDLWLAYTVFLCSGL